MTPQRIQRKRTRGWKMPPNTVYVGRPTKWGNPYSVVKDDRCWSILLNGKSIGVSFSYKYFANNYAVSKFREYIIMRNETMNELRCKNLACWCKLDQPCHADVLLELANKD